MEAERSEAVEDPGGTKREADRRRESALVACLAEGPRETSVSRRSEAPEAATGSGAPKRRTMSNRNGTSGRRKQKPNEEKCDGRTVGGDRLGKRGARALRGRRSGQETGGRALRP